MSKKSKATNKINFQDGGGDDSTEGAAWFIILFLCFPFISFIVKNIKIILISFILIFVIVLFAKARVYRKYKNKNREAI